MLGHCTTTALELVERLVAHLTSANVRATANDEEIDTVGAQLDSLCKAKQQLQKATNASMCVGQRRLHIFQNRDLSAVANGVIDFVTSEVILTCFTADVVAVH